MQSVCDIVFQIVELKNYKKDSFKVFITTFVLKKTNYEK